MSDEITSTSQTVAAGQLLERLDEDARAIGDDKKDVYAELAGCGFDKKAVKALVRLRKMDAAQRQEEESILDLYKAALGMV